LIILNLPQFGERVTNI